MDEALLTPFDSYNKQYKKMHQENVSFFFETLVDATGVDRDANKKTISEILEIQKQLEELKKKKGGKIFLKTLLILAMILFPGLIGMFWYLWAQEKVNIAFPIVTTVLLPAVYTFSFMGLFRISRKIRELDEKKSKLEIELDNLTKLSWQQMAKLNRSYDWNMASNLVHKTIPLLELDNNFNTRRYELLNQRYGFGENKDVNTSTSFVQSGSILGNPFVFSTANIQEWGKKTYSGSITISWTETYRDSDGKMHTRTRTQTLTAYVTKPIPVYRKETKLIFGNDAAPNLSFSRGKSGTLGKSEKQIENMVAKESKQIDKMAKKAVMKQTGYTRIGNDEFESLFGGEDRDNEMEYRLLFTPLAQTNLIKLIKSQEPFGDDFAIYKHKKINVVRSDHSQNFSYLCNPSMFISNSYLDAKIKFETYCNRYFESMFFDFAPLLSIPVYQQYKTKEYIYQNNYPSNVTSFEHEVMANTFNQKDLVDPSSKTTAILKTRFNGRDQRADNVTITAYSFTAIERVEYVSKMGGDGRVHQIPVHWYEYLPVKKETNMEVKEERTTRSDFLDHANDSDFTSFLDKSSLNGNYSYQRGLLAVLLQDEVPQESRNDFSNCLRSFEMPLDETLADFDDSELRQKLFKDDVLNQTIDIVEDIDKSNK